MVSLAPPPQSLHLEAAAGLIVPVAGGLAVPPPPPPPLLEPLLPPQPRAALPADGVAPPARAPCSTWRRVRRSRPRWKTRDQSPRLSSCGCRVDEVGFGEAH